jgi:hypothetical protein
VAQMNIEQIRALDKQKTVVHTSRRHARRAWTASSFVH